MTTKFKDNIVHYAIYTIITFILLSSALSFWNRHVTYDTRSIIEKSELVKSLTISIQENLIQNIDLSIHTFANTGNIAKLEIFNKVVAKKDSVFDLLESNLREQGYEVLKLKDVRSSFDSYLNEGEDLASVIKRGDTLAFRDKLKTFEFPATAQYQDLKNEVVKFENEIEEHARSDYDWSITDNAIIQISLILLSIPILFIASKRLGTEVKNNKELLIELDKNNKKYLYDDGEVSDIQAKSVVEKSISTFKKAFDFVESVSKGNYSLGTTLLTEKQLPLNKQTLMGALLEMSSKLQKSEEEENKRQWVSDGLNKFYEIVRNNQDDAKVLTEKSVNFLTKYLESQQGSLFVLKNDNAVEYLELSSCYAYDRKKWIEKRIEIGEGLVGQTFLEGEPVFLTEIPEGYTTITSGMGDATPTSLLIVPFKYNDRVEAIFEVAGFVKYDASHIEFLNKAGEFLASTLQTVKSSNEMKVLFEQSREQAAILKAQEEELRQNMEELSATNEAIRREETSKIKL